MISLKREKLTSKKRINLLKNICTIFSRHIPSVSRQNVYWLFFYMLFPRVKATLSVKMKLKILIFRNKCHPKHIHLQSVTRFRNHFQSTFEHICLSGNIYLLYAWMYTYIYMSRSSNTWLPSCSTWTWANVVFRFVQVAACLSVNMVTRDEYQWH